MKKVVDFVAVVSFILLCVQIGRYFYKRSTQTPAPIGEGKQGGFEVIYGSKYAM